MKIGILTFHRAINYGAFLQACALCNRLKSEGYDVELIDYRTQTEVNYYNGNSKKLIRKIFDLRSFSFEKSKKKAFLRGYASDLYKVSANSVISDMLEDFLNLVKSKYDVIISGSDEIWKIDGMRGFPTAYWQIGYTGAKKISYAASSRSDFDLLSENNRKIIIETLSEYEYIGVRDKLTLFSLQKLLGEKNKVYYNCDPTLIFSFPVDKCSLFELIKPSINAEKYNAQKKTIVFMSENNHLARIVYKALKKEYNLISVFTRHDHYINISNLSPFEWYSLIAKADFVIASMFHAICVSLKQNTPFLAIGYASKSSKLSDLLIPEFSDNYIEDISLLDSATIINMVKKLMKPVDNSDYIRRQELSFDSFRKTLVELEKSL